MLEHAKRYSRFAGVLNENKITVFAPDHRGHGRTADDTGLGILGVDATWQDWVRNIDQVVNKAKEKYPELPVFLLGHSMGTFISQMYATNHAEKLKGLILSATTEEPWVATRFGMLFTRLLIAIKGKNSSGTLVGFLVFFGYCKDVVSPKSMFDWLTRDSDEVQAYLNDPLCGEMPSLGFFYELFYIMNALFRTNTLKKIPKNLPLYLYAGTKDPLSRNAVRVKKLANRYRGLGHQVSEMYYENGRHEMHNELNREDVFKNVIRWIKLHVS
jgi:alpha-beta hydrolase superfamily lysophospholipase